MNQKKNPAPIHIVRSVSLVEQLWPVWLPRAARLERKLAIELASN